MPPASNAPSAAAPAEEDVALFGKDPLERIVDVQPLLRGAHEAQAQVRLYRRSEDGTRVTEETDDFFPFFFLSDASLLDDFPPERFLAEPLSGDGFFRHLVAFRSWPALWDAVRHLERKTGSRERRPDELYLVGSPVQQYLLQRGRTCLKGMEPGDLHRLQLDIETRSEGRFPNAERPEDEIILIALSDNRGWERLLDSRSVPEATMLEELVQVIREKDPDVIEGHNCFPAGTPVSTPDGYARIENLGVGDSITSRGRSGLETDRVRHVFERQYEGEMVSLRADYRGEVTSTPDHPHFGYRKKAGIGYHAASDFESGDYLTLPYRSIDEPDFDENFYLAGLIFSDGHLSKATNRISFGNTHRPLVEWVAARLNGQQSIRHRENPKATQHDLFRLRTHDAEAHAWFQSLGIPAGDKSSEDAPIAIERVAAHGTSATASFLAGVIDGDGHVSEENRHIHIACHSKRGKVALLELAHHIGLIAGPKKFGVALWPMQATRSLFERIQGWLRLEHKREANLFRKGRRADELPFSVIEKVRPFIKRLGIEYDDFPLPRTTVNYYLNGRTSIHRTTFAHIEETIESFVTNECRAAWAHTKKELRDVRAFQWFPIRGKHVEPFEGTVYNIETENHNYIANGVLTHNCFAFDFDYILKRCDLHGVSFGIGRDGSEPRTFDSSMRFAERTVDFPAIKIAGRHVIDTYFLVMAFDVFKRDLPSYGLKAAARYFGFASEERTYVEGDRITELWEEDPERLREYALDDARETRMLAAHLSGSSFYLTQMLPMTYGRVARTGPASKIESLFVREYLRERRALPRSAWGSQSMGGYTDLFLTGVVGPVVYADVESLYPSIMLRYGIQPAGDTLGLFPRLLRRLTDLRFEAKRQMKAATDAHARSELDARQSSYKVLINSFYGSLGFSLSTFNDFAEADKVTRKGQEILRQMIAAIRARGGAVIEADTDGVFFVPPETDADGRPVRGDAEAERRFTEALTEALPEGIRVGFDGRYRTMLSYKKKNYALLGYDGALKFKGSSLVSRSSERFGRRFVEEAVRLLLEEDLDSLHDLYVETRRRIEEHRWPDGARSFSRTETLKDTLAQYEADVERGKRPRAASYELAKRRNEQSEREVRKGDRVSYYVTGQGKNVTAFENCRRAEDWDPDAPDENTAHYLARLDRFAEKFASFFSEHDFRRLFSPEDLFGFSADGIEIQTQQHEPEAEQYEDEVPF